MLSSLTKRRGQKLRHGFGTLIRNRIYRRSVIAWNCPPFSHGSCLFHGMADPPWSSGSLTSAVCFCAAHEVSATTNAHSKTGTTIVRSLRTCASIDYTVSRLNLDAARQAVGHDIADSSGWFNRRNANFSNQCAISQNEHFGIRFHSIARAEI